MQIKKNRQEMLLEARRLLGLEHTRSDCGAAQTDGIDTDALIAASLRQWYLDLLDRGDVRYLAPQKLEITSSRPSGIAGGAVLRLPDECRRALSVRLAGWHHAVAVRPAAEMAAAVHAQLNGYAAATPSRPVAVCGADGRSIYAWPDPAELGSNEIEGAADTGEDLFVMDDSALSTLPQWLSQLKITDYGSF